MVFRVLLPPPPVKKGRGQLANDLRRHSYKTRRKAHAFGERTGEAHPGRNTLLGGV